VGEALVHIEKSDERYVEAELYRLKGELLLIQLPPAPAEAEASLHKALEVASSQSAKSWELRATTSLARLWQHQGKRAEARELLQPVYDWFTEGFDTQDLKDAKALLDELA
jgi:predicted ATPase